MTPDEKPSAGTDRTRERVMARSRGQQTSAAPTPEAEQSWTREARGWIDALFFAFLLAMFIRTFVFELFMIPTGSMTPTLIGDEARQISEFDWDEDGDLDIVVLPGPGVNSPINYLQVHLRGEDGLFEEMIFLENPSQELRTMFREFRGLGESSSGLARILRNIRGAPSAMNPGAGRRDMIMVNKFSYWFSEPERGDVLVFKTPDRPRVGHPFDPSRPVFIKRVVGLPGEEVVLRPPEQFVARGPEEDRITPASYGGVEYVPIRQPVLIDGEPLTTEPFERLVHFPPPMSRAGFDAIAYNDPLVISTGENGVLMLGDNQLSSLDSRYWGPVPVSHLRGKAVLRYLPLRAFGFLDPESPK